MTSEELYLGCIANHEDTWHYVYNYILSFLGKISVPFQDREDISVDTIIYFMNGAINRIRNPQAFKKLLRLKAMALYMDLGRYKALHPDDPFDGKSENGEINGNPLTALFLEKAIKIIDQCLKTIGIECKNILERYFYGKFRGDNVMDIAEEIGIPYANYRTLVHRCHNKLLKNDNYKQLLEECND